MKDAEKVSENVQRHTISLPPGLSAWAEKARGDVSFSRFTVRALEALRASVSESLDKTGSAAQRAGERQQQKAKAKLRRRCRQR